MNLNVIETLAHKFPNAPLETVMEAVLEAGFFNGDQPDGPAPKSEPIYLRDVACNSDDIRGSLMPDAMAEIADRLLAEQDAAKRHAVVKARRCVRRVRAPTLWRF